VLHYCDISGRNPEEKERKSRAFYGNDSIARTGYKNGIKLKFLGAIVSWLRRLRLQDHLDHLAAVDPVDLQKQNKTV